MAHTGRQPRPTGEGGDEPIPYTKKERASAREMGMEGALNINSLMDIMTILLTFLLVSITSDPWNVKQNQYMQLAESTVDRDPQDSIAILVTKRAIVVDEEDTVPVTCTTACGRQCRTDEDYGKDNNRYFIDKAWKEDSSESAFLVPKLLKKLTEELKVSRDTHADFNREGEFKAITTIICDKDIPYRIIAEVVHTAGNAGIDQLRFAIMRNSIR